MAALTTAVVSRGAPLSQASGGAGAPVAVTSGGDTFGAAPDVFLRFTNSGGSASVVTIATPENAQGLATGPYTLTVPATSGDVVDGPFPASIFTPDGTTVSMTYTNPSGLKVAVVRFPS